MQILDKWENWREITKYDKNTSPNINEPVYCIKYNITNMENGRNKLKNPLYSLLIFWFENNIFNKVYHQVVTLTSHSWDYLE